MLGFWLTVETDVVIGEDDGSVALGDASHGHMEDTMWSLDIMLLRAEPERRWTKDGIHARMRTEKDRDWRPRGWNRYITDLYH